MHTHACMHAHVRAQTHTTYTLVGGITRGSKSTELAGSSLYCMH